MKGTGKVEAPNQEGARLAQASGAPPHQGNGGGARMEFLEFIDGLIRTGCDRCEHSRFAGAITESLRESGLGEGLEERYREPFLKAVAFDCFHRGGQLGTNIRRLLAKDTLRLLHTVAHVLARVGAGVGGPAGSALERGGYL